MIMYNCSLEIWPWRVESILSTSKYFNSWSCSCEDLTQGTLDLKSMTNQTTMFSHSDLLNFDFCKFCHWIFSDITVLMYIKSSCLILIINYFRVITSSHNRFIWKWTGECIKYIFSTGYLVSLSIEKEV